MTTVMVVTEVVEEVVGVEVADLGAEMEVVDLVAGVEVAEVVVDVLVVVLVVGEAVEHQIGQA